MTVLVAPEQQIADPQVGLGDGVLGRGGILLFATREFTRELVNAEPDKHLDVRWHPAGDVLPCLMSPTTKAAVEAYLAAGPAFSTHGFDQRRRVGP